MNIRSPESIELREPSETNPIRTLLIDNEPYAFGNVPSGLGSQEIEEINTAIIDSSYVVRQLLGETRVNRDHDLRGQRLTTVVASGDALTQRVPWLRAYYMEYVCDTASELFGDEALPLSIINEALAAIVLAQGMRIELHFDRYRLNANWFTRMPENPTHTNQAALLAPRGTVIGYPDCTSHKDLLKNPLASIPAEWNTLGLIRGEDLPHSTSNPDGPGAFEPLELTDSFFDRKDVSFSLNFAMTTKSQQQERDAPSLTDAAAGTAPSVLFGSYDSWLVNQADMRG